MDYLLNIEIQNNKSHYPIIIGENLIDNIEKFIKQYTNAKKALIVTNKTIYKIYEKYLNIKKSYVFCVEDGEEYKNIEIYNQIIEYAIKCKIDRKDVFVAFGGGVIGDIVGFCASTYLRGINLIQIPTTLLAQVDSSIGGKVAINSKFGKNLIGNFYQPKLVLSDVNTIKTLDLRQLKTGMSEVLKYSIIQNSCIKTEFNLMEFLDNNVKEIFDFNRNVIAKIIYNCCKMKKNIVLMDEKENNVRAYLNFGHTFAHAIELITQYVKYTHGEAVVFGIIYALILSQKYSLIDENYFNKCITIIKKMDILVEYNKNITFEQIWSALSFDKKNEGGKLKFILSDLNQNAVIKNDIDKRMFENAYKKFLNIV